MLITQMARSFRRDHAVLCLWIGSLLAANVLGAVGGVFLAVSSFIPNADDRALTLFLVGALNGWLLRMLWAAITGRARSKRARRRGRRQ